VDNVRAFGLAARFGLVEGAAAAHHDAKSDRIVQHLAAVAAVLAVEERDLGRVVLVGDSITDAAVAARAAIPAFICPSHSLQPESRDDLRLLGACVFERLADLPALLEEET
jgi:phosphoglycolate phosphatase-like HAD superfamily hydrolase